MDDWMDGLMDGWSYIAKFPRESECGLTAYLTLIGVNTKKDSTVKIISPESSPFQAIANVNLTESQ